jgi:DNA-binding IclR family transcriptional regulator
MATAEAAKPLKISSPPGTSIPLLAGAVGKAFLAQQPKDQVLKIIREHGLSRFTQRSIVKKDDYLAELESVRRRGYAIDNEEYLPGVKAVAMALGNQRAAWPFGWSGLRIRWGQRHGWIAEETRHASVQLSEVLDSRA